MTLEMSAWWQENGELAGSEYIKLRHSWQGLSVEPWYFVECRLKSCLLL